MWEKPWRTPFFELPMKHLHQDGLVARYLFNDGAIPESANTVYDYTKNGNILDIVNATWEPTGLRTDANGEYASLNNTKQIVNFNQGTIIIEFKSFGAFADNSYHCLFGREGTVRDSGDFIFYKHANNNLYFWLTDDVGGHLVYIQSAQVPNWQVGTFLTLVWDINNVIHSGVNMIINVNGKHIAPVGSTNATSWNSVTVQTPLGIGNDSDALTRFSNGIIKDMSIYNKALDESTIKNICYNQYEIFQGSSERP